MCAPLRPPHSSVPPARPRSRLLRTAVVGACLALLPNLSSQITGVGAITASDLNENAITRPPDPHTAAHPFPDGPSPTRPRALVYFPPIPPPLGQISPPSGLLRSSVTAPDELAAYAGELFYPALAARLAKRKLTDRQRERLARYQADKLAQLSALRAALAPALTPTPAERAAALADFARTQAPLLAALEETAEALRADLVLRDMTWSSQRTWHLGDSDPRGYTPAEIVGVMRDSAFFQDGHGPAQRRLLLEIALELTTAAGSVEAAADRQPYLFFSPTLARIRPPADLPAALAAQLSAYESQRAALKKELYDAVVRADTASLAVIRAGRFRTHAAQQAPALAALETLADEIRRGFAQLPAFPPPAVASPLPSDLTERIAALIRRQTDAQQETAAQVEHVRLAHESTVSFHARFSPTGLHYRVSPRYARSPREKAEALARVATVETALAAIAGPYERTVEAMTDERTAIRHAIPAVIGSDDPARINVAFAQATRAVLERQHESALHDYRLAVFAPGLSAEQRRLLFDAAITDLGLRLPLGELQPTTRVVPR